MKTRILYVVDLPYAHYGIEVESGEIVNAPPIAKWMIGKTLEYVQSWTLSKGGTLQKLR